MTLITSLFVLILTTCDRLGDRLANHYRAELDPDAGEGVVSAAIAVLIFAFLGVILWVAFKATMGTATNAVNAQVAKLGQ